MYDRFGKIHTKIKFKCFGKTRVKKNGNKNQQTNENNNTKDDDKIIENILKQKSTRLAKEIEELKTCSKSRPTRTFKLLKKSKDLRK